jgi:transposase
MTRGPSNIVAAIKRHRDKDYPRAVFEHACALLRQRQKQRRGHRLSFDAIAKAVGVASRQTVWAWNRKLLLENSRRLQTQKRGRPSALTTEQRRVLAGKVIAEHVQHHDTKTEDVMRWSRDLFGTRISHHHVSRLSVEFEFTPRLAQSITKEALTPEKRCQFDSLSCECLGRINTSFPLIRTDAPGGIQRPCRRPTLHRKWMAT